MNTTEKRLSLADFKAKADSTNTIEALEAIQGGDIFGCHTVGSRIGKKLEGYLDEAAKKLIDKI